MATVKKNINKTLEKAKNTVKNGTSKIKDKVKNKNRVLSLLLLIGIIIALVVLVFGLYIIISAPDFNETKLYNKESSVLYYNDGTEMTRIGTGSLNNTENRVLVTYDDLPQVFVDALIATEDSRFFQHNGFDAARFLKASMNQAVGRDAGGASTLTMQVVKNTYTDKTVSIIRKFTDIYMAVFKLEKVYTKEEIIEFYVNSQWLGNGNTNYNGVYGVEQASQMYFGKSVNDLSLPEASLLVGMFNNPSYYNPIKNPENAKSRQKTVLSLMVKHGYITKEDADAAADISIESLLKVTTESQKSDTQGLQAFIDYVLKDVKNKTGVDPTLTPMAIYTTMDKDIQNTVTALENGELYTFADDKIQNGIAITSTVDGSILALGGGRNYVASGLNRATDIKRQPGSTAKPIFDYGPYIEYNNGSPGSIFFDEPYTYSTGGSIKNYDNAYKGEITMRAALIDSRNIPALQAFQQVDKDKIADFAHSLGIDYGENLYESCSIGGFDGVNPLQMSAAYAAFGRGGYFIEPYSFTKIVYLENEEEFNYKYTKTRVMSEETAYLITDILVDGGASGVGGSIKVSGTEVAAKGGTTTADSAADLPSTATPDHWNNVYTPDYSISVWVGYDTTTKAHYLTSSTGGTARRKIMAAVANKILKKNSKFTMPSGVISVTYEYDTFPIQLASEYTPSDLRRTELFRKGTEPPSTQVSTRFSTLENPTNGSSIVNGSSITLSWDPIKTPSAIDTAELQEYFNKNYGQFASKYYEQRIAYNQSYIGTLGYQVYLENNDGTLTSLGYTNSSSYNYVAPAAGNYKFVIKSSYSIFKANMSSGLTITANLVNNDSTNKTDNNNITSTNENTLPVIGNNNNN